MERTRSALPRIHLRRALVAIVVACLVAGCSKTYEGFDASFSTASGFYFRQTALAPDALNVTFERRVLGPKYDYIDAWPARAKLSLHGFAPVEPEQVKEVDGRYELRFRLPPDFLRAAQSGFDGRWITYGDLQVPTSRTVAGFSGTEQRVWDTASARMTLVPKVKVGGVEGRFAEGVGNFLRSLYAAR